ncbi:hypothetical protein K0M31_018534, partial [Melipona bicolor]
AAFYKFGRLVTEHLATTDFERYCYRGYVGTVEVQIATRKLKTLKWCSLRVQGADEQAIEADPASVERE